MARTGRRFPEHRRLVPFPPQILPGGSTMSVVTGMTAGGTQSTPATAMLPVIFGMAASQFSATLPVVFGMTAGGTLTLQQAAELDAVFTISAGSTLTTPGAATLPAVFTIGTRPGVQYATTMSVVTALTAIPTTGLLTLICSIAAAAGTDAQGNAYPGPGLCVGIPLGPQIFADASGNLIIGGNLTVDGSMNTPDSAVIAALAAQVAALTAAEATDAANINTLQNGLATAITDEGSDFTNLQAQLTVFSNAFAGANFGFLSNLVGKLPNQTAGNATGFNATNFANLVNAVNALQQHLQDKNFEF